MSPNFCNLKEEKLRSNYLDQLIKKIEEQKSKALLKNFFFKN